MSLDSSTTPLRLLLRAGCRRLITTIVMYSLLVGGGLLCAAEIFVRASQVGYRPGDQKIAIAFSKTNLPNSFRVEPIPGGKTVFEATVTPIKRVRWGQFEAHAELDFSKVTTPGRYVVRCGDARSPPFSIAQNARAELPATLLEFLRQQRCGFNPWLGTNCHSFDAKTAYGPMPNGSYLDVQGGWHDAGDLLKYLLTSGNATAQLLLAAQLGGKTAEDRFDARGLPASNGISDVADEARWGLQWMIKLHPAPDQLYHQVGDDRDHAGWRLPQNEIADYGWGQGGPRVVYFADGNPQGLQQYKSASTGLGNLAGRYAAAMALAWQVFHTNSSLAAFAERCLQAGKEVYELGRSHEGVQQGNSYTAPYRYEETTWADDMEWGAAELFRTTREERYRHEAIHYSELAANDTWMGKEQTGHYQYYPFINLGHFRLYDLVERRLQKKLAGYYREGIERCLAAGRMNPYQVGVPFIWCSDNLVVALTTQCVLYERMTGDVRFSAFCACQRDWLVGRNPWGYSMFTGIGAQFPKNPHLMTTYLTHRTVPGGLVDGPVYDRIFKSLKGVAITEPDPLAAFQGLAVYHDDVQDYSSNEPTMDGTASAILMWTLCDNRRP